MVLMAITRQWECDASAKLLCSATVTSESDGLADSGHVFGLPGNKYCAGQVGPARVTPNASESSCFECLTKPTESKSKQ